jgi:ParB-like chromosome segregation protein Spo0J
MNEAKFAFEMRRIRVLLEDILPVRQVKSPQKAAGRYHTILASIREVGLIEPLMIHPQKGMPGKYLLLDGHMRHHALKELGETEADCLISTQDESYTYDARVNRLNPIQEHKMITRAVKNGVPPERIAAAFNLPVENTYCSAGRSGDSSLRRQNPPLPLPPGSFS